MKVMKDGFVYKLVSGDKAKDIFSLELFELYVIHDDDSESLIDTRNDLIQAIENGKEIGIPVGIAMNTTEAKQALREAGYFVDNLWHVDDVKNATEVSLSTDQAMQVLRTALTNEATMEQIWMSIQMATEILTDKIK